MADVRPVRTRNFTASDRDCGCCGSNYNTWKIEVVERTPTGTAISSTYFYCFVCDKGS